MTATEQVYQSLPTEFTRQDVLDKAKDHNLAYSTASSLPAKLLFEEKAERISAGKYKKISNKKTISQ